MAGVSAAAHISGRRPDDEEYPRLSAGAVCSYRMENAGAIMKILKWMKRERSGLAFTTLELAKYEERQGHTVCIREPSGPVVHGREESPDVHTIHSQIDPAFYHDNKPKFLWAHGEALSSVGNGVSMKAIVDLANICEAIICMRADEVSHWRYIKRTFRVPKGIDLEVFRPLDGITEKLSGEPAVLYYENIRGQRNPLFAILAMAEVYKKFPKARLHIYNITDKRTFQTFDALIKHCKFWPFVRSLQGAVNDVNLLLNRCDIVVSCLSPLYARSIEAFGAGKGLIAPGYREYGYRFPCQLSPESIASAIISLWENYDFYNWREWAISHHNVDDTVKESVTIYQRYI